MHRDQLETLAALIDSGTFEAAASRLHISASAVSQRVKAMEQNAGQIFVRRTTPVTLTEAGTVALRYARQVELLETETAAALARISGSPGSSGATLIPLAVNADSLATWFLEALAGLDRHLSFDLRREDQQLTTDLLRAGTVMAAVTSTRDAVQACTTEALGAMRYRAVCSPAFAERWGVAPDPSVLDGTQDPSLRRLETAPVVHFDRNDDLQLAFLRRLGLRTDAGPRHYIPTSDDFARAVTLGFGWGVLPEQQCTGPLADGMLVELAPTQPVDVPLYWQRWNLTSVTLDAVSEAVRVAARAALRQA